MDKKLISVAIDGPSGAGKSTIARRAAAELGFVYVDTGAIYRTVGYFAFTQGVDPTDRDGVVALLPRISVEMGYGEDGLQHMKLNGQDVTKEIRLPQISMYASHVSAIPEVRDFLMEMQRAAARKDCVIMDGRDIGTVVLPNAEVKIFLTATPEERARRRHLELVERGTPQEYDTILEEIRQRDYNDTHRATAPLRPAEDSVIVDSTELNFEESCAKVLSIIREQM